MFGEPIARTWSGRVRTVRSWCGLLELDRANHVLALIAAALTVAIGLAAMAAAGTSVDRVVLVTATTAAVLAASLLLTGRRSGPLLTIAALLVLSAFAAEVRPLAPTVVWMYAFVVPALGIVHGRWTGALAGLIAAPALHWIETGIAFDPLDPQAPFGFVILVALGAIPAHLVRIATDRRDALDRELARTAALLVEAQTARAAEARARHEAIYMLARAAEARDGTTGAHILSLRDLSRELAARIGLPEHQVEEIAWSGMLHDVGKLRVPDRVLLKPGALDPEEWAVIREHPRWGEEILSDDSAFDLARAIARSHHENWDGTGYPDRLRGERIPLAARIVRIADVYDALRAERPYKRAWSNEEALEELGRMAGTGLDPELARVFVDLRAGSA